MYTAPLYNATSHVASIREASWLNGEAMSGAGTRTTVCRARIQYPTSTRDARFRAVAVSPLIREVTRQQGLFCGAILREIIAVHRVGELRADGARVHDL